MASGLSYIHVKPPSFLGIFLCPSFFGSIGAANATHFTAIFPLVGLLAAACLLPEVYGRDGATGADCPQLSAVTQVGHRALSLNPSG